MFAPDMRPVEELERGPGRLPHRVDQARRRREDGRDDHRRRSSPTAAPCPGYRDAKPMVFAGLYPIEDTDYEGPARRAREAPPERLRLQLRAGDLARARLRLPLRLPRHAPPRDRPGAARARVQPLADRHRAQRALPGGDDRRARRIEVENPSKLPPVDKIERIEEPYVRGSIFVPTEFMSEIYKLAQDKRGEHKSLEYVGKRVPHPVRLPAERDRGGLLRPAQVHLQGLRLVRLRFPRVPARPTWSSSTSS